MDDRAECFCFSRVWRALTEVLSRDICANDPGMSAGFPARTLPLWAVFSFLRSAAGVGNSVPELPTALFQVISSCLKDLGNK